MSNHLEASLQRDIDRIRGKVTEMCGLCEQALKTCIKAIAERNRQLAYAVILRDQYIDELEKEVDRLCLEFLVRQQPVARNLRLAYSAIKINLDLERVGDYAESIARQTLKLIPMDVQIPIERFTEIAHLSISMLKDAIQAFVDQNEELAHKTIETEDAVDQLKSKLNKDFVAMFRENKIPFESLNPLMMIARRLERVSDQARNMCMEVLYVCTGEYVRHAGSEVFRVLFVDQHDSCRSKMAEAIADSLNESRFLFTGVGIDPTPVGTSTLEFLKSKGLDVSRLAPKAINQVPNLDHYHVIVVLADEAKKAFPKKPRKVVFLDWAVRDPSTVQGSAEEIKAAYEETYQFIEDHLKDLVQAILGK